MAIKIYSDKTNKFYDTVEDANRAEFELKEQENLEKIRKERELAEAKAQKEKAAAERKEAAVKVDEARKAMIEAQKAYRTELEAFCKKYGTYHYSTNSADDLPAFFDWVGNIFRF